MKSPQELGLPYPSWRPGQRLALRTIFAARTPHIVINAPTGAGKSTLAAALTRMDDRRQVILTATKGLMDQYQAFDFLYDVRGMANYECLAARDEFKRFFPIRRSRVMCDDGPCHSGASCSLKESGCLYFDRYRSSLGAQAVVTNYPYWLTMRRYGRGLGIAQRLIADEAHALPEQLMSANRIEIHKSHLTSRVPNNVTAWRRWALQALNTHGTTHGVADDQRILREKTIQGFKALSEIDETWAWDDVGHSIVFEPTIPRLLMPSLQHLDRYSSIVYLSATITPATLDLLGVDASDVTYWEMQSTFPPERRPIYLVPGARVDFRTLKDRVKRQRWYDTMREICELREDRSGIIHTVSFDRAEELFAVLSATSDRYLLHRRGVPGAKIVAAFKASPRGTVLISPSVMTGFDFPYRECEFQILAKVPFPDTRSKIVTARIKATPRYRDHLTMQMFVQACGRGMRADDDQCETFCVDEHAQWFLHEHQDIAPPWFKAAIVKTGRRILPPKRL